MIKKFNEYSKPETDEITEANPDGTISDGEEKERSEFLKKFKDDIHSLMVEGVKRSNEIGGSFRSPGIQAQMIQIIKKELSGFSAVVAAKGGMRGE